MSNQSDHITFIQLVDLAEGRIAADAAVAARSHVAACARCAADLAWLERVIGLMRTDTSEHPPPRALAAAKRLFKPPTPRRQFMAMLQFDSARTPVALGRRAGTQTERQMLFAVSDYLLDLRVVSNGALWVVSGQLLGAEDARLAALDGPAGTVQVMLNELSEFVLPPTPSGVYRLRVELADLDITIAGLEIGR